MDDRTIEALASGEPDPHHISHHPRTLLEIYQRGDKLSDAELPVLGGKMQALAKLCFEFGPMFQLQAAYAQKVADDCRRFIAARAEKF